jgi:hypothetical protein
MKPAVPTATTTNFVRAQHCCAPNAQALNPQVPEVRVFEPNSPVALHIGLEPMQELTMIFGLPYPDDEEVHS